MTRAEGIAYLTKDGNLAVPCSRYGNDTESCAPVAWRLAYVLARSTGEPITEESLHETMGLVVNDSDEVASVIRSHGNYKYV